MIKSRRIWAGHIARLSTKRMPIGFLMGKLEEDRLEGLDAGGRVIRWDDLD
jgi:hypothetical protein